MRSVPFAAAVAAFLVSQAPAGAQQMAALSGHAGARGADRVALTAVRVGGDAPVVDGLLDDAAWRRALPTGPFTQFRPDPGAPSSQRTEARVLYDERAIYVGVRMHDTEAAAIVGRLGRRDQGVYSDWIYVAFDSYYDRRTGFTFGVNPAGVKMDIFMSDDTNEDSGWDAIWDVATSVDSLGWSAEFRIPLSQLRFAETEGPRTWGIQFVRKIARLNEESAWSPMPRDANGLVSLFGDLHGLDGLEPPDRLELLPYSMTRLTRSPGASGDPFHEANALAAELGGDLAWGVTPYLTLNATVNPDFGQVEADPSVVNLSAFETFFPEKRPFFLEGADIFRFGLGLGDGDFGNESLFYSRRVGRAPQGSTPGDALYRQAPTATTILGAAKLSGKTANGWSVGFLDAVTSEETARFAIDGDVTGEAVVEPLTNYAVGRVIRDFRNGESAVGGIFTATNRRLDATDLDQLRTAAYSAGLNARHRFGGGDYQLSGWLVGSHVRGDSAAMDATQRSSARYFQRPDAGHVEYDPRRASLAGWGGSLELAKLGGGHWRWILAGNVRSPGFETNDLGFMRSADRIMQVAYVGYDQFRPGPIFQRWRINANQWASWSFGGERIELGGNINGNFQLPSYWGGGAGVNRNQSALSPTALRGGPALVTPGSTSAWFNVYSDSRRPVSLSLNGNWAAEDDTPSRSFSVSTGVNVRASTRAELSLSPRFSRNRNAWQWVGRRTAGAAPHYVFGGLEQTTVSLTARVGYTFAPGLSLQFYAQPFLSAGRYAEFREVADPRAADFDDRLRLLGDDRLAWDAGTRRYTVDTDGDADADYDFGNPDFNVQELRTNAVLRWEYRPGSTLFVVWSHGRSAEGEPGDFSFRRDARTLFDAPATNVLLVKMSYWLGF